MACFGPGCDREIQDGGRSWGNNVIQDVKPWIASFVGGRR
jgi:hypothetical protein